MIAEMLGRVPGSSANHLRVTPFNLDLFFVSSITHVDCVFARGLVSL